MSGPRILVVTLFDDGWTWLSSYFQEESYEWYFLRSNELNNGRVGALRQAWRAFWKARDYDLIITHGPWLTLFLSVMMKTSNRSTPHIGFTFNHGNGIFFSGLFLWAARASLKNVERFVTHSNYERKLLAKRYNIDLDKIVFTHWAVQDPVRTNQHPDYIQDGEKFITCIGRNNRDIPTFLAAMKNLPWRAVVICRHSDVQNLEIPENVTVRTDVSLEECNQVLDRTSLSVVPLLDDSTGAGHMTIVSAMLRGKPLVLTNCEGVMDYFVEEEHGLFCRPNCSKSLREAITALMSDEKRRKRMSMSCRSFAEQYFTEPSAAQFLRDTLEKHFGTISKQERIPEPKMGY